MKRMLALLLSIAIVMSMSSFALADSADDILRIDGKTGRIWLAFDDEGEGYNYPLKYLYDISWDYTQAEGDYNLAEVVTFLSKGRQEGFDPRVDIDSFINSAMGEKTAELWYQKIMWADQMAEGLIEYWENHGIKKEAFLDAEQGDDGIKGDYFVYTPVDMDAAKKYPLVVLFHGGGEVAYQTETFGFVQMIPDEEFIVVAQDSNMLGKKDGADTLEKQCAQMNTIIDTLTAKYPVDTTRVYVVGSSGGGSDTMKYVTANVKKVAAAAVMDQPATLATRWWAASEEQIAEMSEYGLPMCYLGGTADCYGLWGMQDLDFYNTSEGSEPQFISGWNSLMDAFNIEGKDLTAELRVELATNPSNEAEKYNGYPFDKVENIDTTGNSAIYKCTMNSNDKLAAFIVENRAHMPSGFDAESIWSHISQFARDAETGMSVKIAE